MQIFKKSFLFIVSIFYGITVEIRNFCFDIKLFKNYKSSIFTLVVGNITVGGSGKSPFILFLIKNLKRQYKIAVVSRGYSRKSNGLIVVNADSTIEEIGDEMFDLFASTTQEILMICSNSRVEAVKYIEKFHSEISLILLDDGFQHRWLEPHCAIILESFHHPVMSDYLLPFGKLREPSFRIKRADFFIQTKVPLSDFAENKNFDFRTYQKYTIEKSDLNVNLLSALADNQHFLLEMAHYFTVENYFFFKDHYFYSEIKLAKILGKSDLPIVTTTKDWAKIKNIIPPNRIKRFIIIEVEIEFVKEKELFLEKLTTKINNHLLTSLKNE